MLRDQGALCAVSGILLRGVSSEFPWYQMSVDAIDPTKGHVPGNLRIVCRFLNNGNSDKMKKAHFTTDHPTSWTTALLRYWVGYGDVVAI